MPKSGLTPPRPMPQVLLQAHRRALEVGFGRAAWEGALAAACVAAVLGLLVAPWVRGTTAYVLIASSVALAGVAAGVLLALVLPMVDELSASRLRIRKLATHDTDTGLVNHRHFSFMAQREWERCRRYRSGTTMLVVEVDHLSKVEDQHGRAASAAVMRAVALACESALRKSDLLGRHHGAMFAAFLPHTEMLGAIDVAERLRGMVAETAVPWNRGPIRVTVSIGVAALGEAHASLAALVSETESALVAAQKAGRNCVRVSPQRGSRSSRDYPVMPG